MSFYNRVNFNGYGGRRRSEVVVTSTKLTRMNVERENDVCLVIDLECFRVRGQPCYRELGYCTWQGHSGRVAFLPRHPFHQLHRDDKRQIAFLTKHIHGLTYLPSDTEQAVSTPVDDVVQRLYADSACDHRRCVAFKGGHLERDVLLRLNIPYLDLETLGCPKYNLLRRGDEQTCGHHASPGRHHCAMAECRVFFDWYKKFHRNILISTS